jgi:hypothetical protein
VATERQIIAKLIPALLEITSSIIALRSAMLMDKQGKHDEFLDQIEISIEHSKTLFELLREIIDEMSEDARSRP